MGIDSTFIESVKRVTANPDFGDRFYELFIGSDPRIPEMFKKTDFIKQKLMLRRSVMMLVKHSVGISETSKPFVDLAQEHGPTKMAIPLDLYRNWLNCLVKTASEIDSRWTPDLKRQWEKRFGDEVQRFIAASQK